MQWAILLLLVVALGFLVLGIVGSATPLITASLVTSVLVVLLIIRSRRRAAEQGGGHARPAEAPVRSDRPAAPAVEPVSSTVQAPPAAAPVEPTPAPAVLSTPAPPAPPAAELPVLDVDEPLGEPPAALTEAPLRAHGDEPVWVVDGRPRYHLWACHFIVGKGAQQITLRQATEDEFTPCSLCDPDTQIAGG